MVRTRTAVDAVVTALSLDPVIATPAEEVIVLAIPNQRVVVKRPMEKFESHDPIALGVPPMQHARIQVHVYGFARLPIVQHISLSAPTVHAVRPLSTLYPVVARIADEGVVVPGAQDVLEVRNNVALRMSAGDREGGDIDVYAGVGLPVQQPVRPDAAVEGIGARPPCDPVLSIPAIDAVCTRPPVHPVTSIPAADAVRARASQEPIALVVAGEGIVVGGAGDLLEAADGVAFGLPAGGGVVGEIDADAFVGISISEVIPASSPPVEGVRAFAALDPVVARVADEGVGMGGTDEVLEAADGVAFGMPAGGGVVGKADSDAHGGVIVIEVVVALPSFEAVSTAMTLDGIVDAVADEGVAVGGADDLMEPGEGVAVGVAAGAPA